MGNLICTYMYFAVNLSMKFSFLLFNLHSETRSTWASEHLSHPNPSREQREDLAKESGVTYVQVSAFCYRYSRVTLPCL